MELVLREGGVLPSAALGLEGVVDGRLLRFRDPVKGLLIPTAQEAEQARQEEARRRQELEAQLAALLDRVLRPMTQRWSTDPPNSRPRCCNPRRRSAGAEH